MFPRLNKMRGWFTSLLLVLLCTGFVLASIGHFILANNYETISTVQENGRSNLNIVEDVCHFQVNVEEENVFRQTELVQVNDDDQPHYLLILGGRFGPELSDDHFYTNPNELLDLAVKAAGPIHYAEVRQLGDGIVEVYCRSDYTMDLNLNK